MPTIIRPATPAEAQAIASNLQAFNASRIGACAVQTFSRVAIEGSDLVGGVLARTAIEWLQVDMLWVTEVRRRFGIGRALLVVAEAEAQRRGCRGAVLDTFDWQAEPFYRKQGYEVFGRLEDCPSPGHVRTYIRKMLNRETTS